jgi:hypothetical protein
MRQGVISQAQGGTGERNEGGIMLPDYRRHQEPGAMSTDDLVECYGLASRLRRHEVTESLDTHLDLWMFAARSELESRGLLDRIREWLPIAFDPTKKNPLSGHGAKLVSPAAIERAIAPRALKSAG